jgi:hypothetical protein
MFMKSFNKSWTETHWYYGAGSGVGGLIDDFTAVGDAVLPNGLTQQRWNILANGCALTEVRASQEVVYKDSEVSVKPLAYGTGSSVTNDTYENTGNDCLAVRMESTDQNRATIYLGGVPDYTINKEVFVNGNAGWNTFFANYMNILTKNGVPGAAAAVWGFLSLNKNPVSFPRVQIASIVLDPGTPITLTVTTVQNHNVPSNNMVANTLLNSVVRISYAANNTPNSPVNQLYTVANVPGSKQLTLLAPNWPATTTFVSQGKSGFLQNMVKSFYPYQTFGVPVAGTRKRGVTANLPRGRFKRPAGVGY